MGIMAMMKNRNLIFIFFASFFSQNTFSGDLVLSPKIIFEEVFTDNVNLSRTSEESSFVSRAGISIDSKYTSQHLSINFLSESKYVTYSHNSGSNTDNHKLNSDIYIDLNHFGFSLVGEASIDNVPLNGADNSLADSISSDTTRVQKLFRGINECSINI